MGRLAFQTIDRSGYGRNEVTGSDINDANHQALRGQLLFDITDDVTLLLATEYGREDDAANGFLYKRETFPGSTNPVAIANGIGGFANGERNYASNVNPVNDRETLSYSATLDWIIDDHWALKNIFNSRDTEMLNFQDLDASAVVNSTIQEFVFDAQQVSEEIQLSYNDDDIRGIVGLYYFQEDLHHENNIDAIKDGGSFLSPLGVAEKRVNLIGEGESESWAAFWNLSYDLTDAVTLKAGGRYTEDKRSIVNDNVIWAGPNRLTLKFEDDDKFTDYSSEIGIEWRPNDDMMVYYTYSEGFKAGTGQLGSNSADIIDPESITNHEFGLKSSWLDSSLVLNIAAYAYEVDDIQLDRTLVGGPTGFRTVFENATTQQGQGVEAEVFWAATDQLRLNASLSYQDTEFDSFLTTDPTNENNVPPGIVTLVDIAGNSSRQSPAWAWNLHGEYDMQLSIDGVLTLIADVSFKDDQYFSEFNNALLFQEDYTLVDARIKYTSADENWVAEIWGKNLGDKLVESGNYALASGRVTTRTLLPPRTYGITVSYKF